MANAAKIDADLTTLFATAWDVRTGRVVPSTDDVILRNGAVRLDAVLLYADLFHSTTLARTFDRKTAAKIVRGYLSSMTQMITTHGGVVRSFDGDRVMGVFVGDAKNSNAAKCALRMNYVVGQILRPKAETKFPSLKIKGFVIDHCAGVSKSEVFVVRGGVRGSNDLVFVGSAPNIAAKLSDIRNAPYASYITWDVYNNLNSASKMSGDTNMWVETRRTLGDTSWRLYKSSWHWKP